MRRFVAPLAALVLVASGVLAAAPARAAVTMAGRIDAVTVRYQGGPVLEVYGWADKAGSEGTNDDLVTVTITGPDGGVLSSDITQPLLADQQFTNGMDDHPVANQYGYVAHHGFWTMASPALAGVYTVCAQAAPSYPTPSASSWTPLGCSTTTVAPRVIDSGITAVGPHPGSSGLFIDGWLTDSWDEFGHTARFDISYSNRPAGLPDADLPPQAVSGANFADPSSALSAQHPRASGLRSMSAVIDPAAPGTYVVCATVTDETSAISSKTCSGSVTITAAYVTKSASVPLGSTVPVGQSVSVTPATWTPTSANVVDRLVMESGDNMALPSAAAGGALYVAPSVTGRDVCIVETASIPGGVPASERWCYRAEFAETGTTRLSGADRFATAVAISRSAFSGTTPQTVYVASGDSFADALSVGPVVAKTGSDLLLTAPSSLPASTRSELQRLQPGRIVIVGGTAAVSDAVMSELRGLAPAVTRIGGVDRYATSRAIIAAAYPAGSAAHVLIATGRNYPDAEAGVPAAVALAAPILLVDGSASSADAASLAAITRLGSTSVTVIGGTSAVSSGVAAAMNSGRTVARLAGADRYATAVALARLAAPTTTANVYVASGSSFPDALAAASLMAVRPGPIYLTQQLCASPGAIGDMVRAHASSVTLLGGYAAVGYDSLLACLP